MAMSDKSSPGKLALGGILIFPPVLNLHDMLTTRTCNVVFSAIDSVLFRF